MKSLSSILKNYVQFYKDVVQSIEQYISREQLWGKAVESLQSLSTAAKD